MASFLFFLTEVSDFYSFFVQHHQLLNNYNIIIENVKIYGNSSFQVP
jgi:hypothetical protein